MSNYRSKNPEVRNLLDRPRHHEWFDFEVERMEVSNNGQPLMLPIGYRNLVMNDYEGKMGMPGFHEVAALVDSMAVFLPRKLHRHLHRGLTSSNVIDSCNHRRWRRLLGLLRADSAFAPPVEWKQFTYGYTHGKRADVTTVLHRLNSLTDANLGAAHMLAQMDEWFEHNDVVLGGPVGYGSEQGNRQAVFRYAYFPLWMAIRMMSAAGAQVATDYRFYCSDFLPEVQANMQSPVTSSCMPHKQNPSEFERLVGLDHLIGSMVATLITLPPMWLDRDLVHSSVERETIDRLWDTFFYGSELLRKLVLTTKLEIKPLPRHNGRDVFTSHNVYEHLLADGLSHLEARQEAAERAANGEVLETWKGIQQNA